MTSDADRFEMEVARDFCDEPFEIIIEITGYHPGDKRYYHGCERDWGYIEIDAWTMDGKHFELTPDEDDRARGMALEHIKQQAKEAEEADYGDD